MQPFILHKESIETLNPLPNQWLHKAFCKRSAGSNSKTTRRLRHAPP